MDPHLHHRSNEPLRKAIGKLVKGLEKRDQEQKQRRRHHRYYFGARVSLVRGTDADGYEPLCEVYAVDVSMGGISCIAKQELPMDTAIFVNFDRLVGKPCLIPINICESVNLLEGVFRIHAQYVLPG